MFSKKGCFDPNFCEQVRQALIDRFMNVKVIPNYVVYSPGGNIKTNVLHLKIADPDYGMYIVPYKLNRTRVIKIYPGRIGDVAGLGFKVMYRVLNDCSSIQMMLDGVSIARTMILDHKSMDDLRQSAQQDSEALHWE